jgi:hypothetical protein
VALAVWEFAKDNPNGWTGTTKHLKSILDGQPHDSDGWPKSPKGLGEALRRMGPALREVGVYVESARTRDGYELNIKYKPSCENSWGQCSQRSQVHRPLPLGDFQPTVQ